MESTLTKLADIADNLSLPAWEASNFSVTQKADGSPVTDVDVAIEVAIRAAINTSFPADGFCGEEVGMSPGSPPGSASQRTWIVDGIDGTRSFTSGGRAWSTHIALTESGVPTAGMVTCPALGRRWYTADLTNAHVGGRGQAATRLAVSGQQHLQQARVARWPVSREVKPALASFARRISSLTNTAQSILVASKDSVSTGAMLVADGRLDAFVMFGGQPWDHAAPAAVVRASGGAFSCLAGTDSLATGAGVYSNGRVHRELIDALQANADERGT